MSKYKLEHSIKKHFKILFPNHPYLLLGKRTGTLLHHVLSKSNRTTTLMPGFICPELSAMVLSTGKTIVHIDIDQTSMQMQTDQIYRYLDLNTPAETCLLIDHSFGYVNPAIAAIKEQYPNLLIIEDCARTLGGYYQSKPAGYFGDIIIFSMYKTVPGNEHGGILLSRKPLPSKNNLPRTFSTPREYLSKNKLLRTIHGKIKRKKSPLGAEPSMRESISCKLEPGLPSKLAKYRFLKELENLEQTRKQRKLAWDHLQQHLMQNKKIRLIITLPHTEPAYFFLSFTIPEIPDIHSFLQRLNQKGHFLFNAWPDPPCYYRCFAGTYLYGDKNTFHLARNIIHIAINDYLDNNNREKFIIYIDTLLAEL